MNEPNNQLLVILKMLFKLTKVKFIENDLNDKLLKQPNYPNITALPHLLDELDIKNKLGKISIDELIDLTPVFIVPVFNFGVVIITEIGKESIKYFSSVGGWVKEELNEFNKKWNGVVLLIDYSNQKQIINFRQNKFREALLKWRFPIFIFSVLLFIVSFTSLKKHIDYVIVIFVTKFIGTAISSILSAIEFSKNSDSKFCSSKGGFNCNDVLNSKMTKVFLPWATMPDIGLIYFFLGIISVFIILIIPSQFDIIYLLAALSILALPYVLISIYYQYRIKSWCVYCLGVMSILVIESFISINFIYNYNFIFSEKSMLLLLCLTIGLLVIWSYLKTLLVKHHKMRQPYYNYFRLKKNKEIFYNLQKNEKYFNTDILESKIFLKKDDDLKTLIFVINPFCNYCASKINEISKLENFNISIIFSNSKDDEITCYLIELYYKLSINEFLSALRKWFEISKFEDFKYIYNYKTSNKARKTFKEHLLWCTNNNVITTPVLIFENNELSNYYSLKEVNDLIK